MISEQLDTAAPAPPDKDHTYVFVVYALDAQIDLEEGFEENGIP